MGRPRLHGMALNRIWNHANFGQKIGDFFGMCDLALPVLSSYSLVVFHGGTFEPRMPKGRRQRGRPRQIWVAHVR